MRNYEAVLDILADEHGTVDEPTGQSWLCTGLCIYCTSRSQIYQPFILSVYLPVYLMHLFLTYRINNPPLSALEACLRQCTIQIYDLYLLPLPPPINLCINDSLPSEFRQSEMLTHSKSPPGPIFPVQDANLKKKCCTEKPKTE